MRRLTAGLLANDKLRFLLGGASTTAFSYLLYAALLLAMPAKVAYAISWVAGIGWSYWVSSVWVFRRAMSWRGMLSFPLVYLAQAGLSFLLFVLLVDHWRMPALAAPLVIIVLMLPVTYLLGRAVIHRTSPAPKPQVDSPPR
jgi:putative flippase GtrA